MKDCRFSMIVSLFLIPMKDLFRENLNNEEQFTVLDCPLYCAELVQMKNLYFVRNKFCM